MNLIAEIPGLELKQVLTLMPISLPILMGTFSCYWKLFKMPH